MFRKMRNIKVSYYNGRSESGKTFWVSDENGLVMQYLEGSDHVYLSRKITIEEVIDSLLKRGYKVVIEKAK